MGRPLIGGIPHLRREMWGPPGLVDSWRDRRSLDFRSGRQMLMARVACCVRTACYFGSVIEPSLISFRGCWVRALLLGSALCFSCAAQIAGPSANAVQSDIDPG